MRSIQTLEQVEKEMTAEELLVSQGLNPSLYFVAVEGKLIQGKETIKQSQTAKIIPRVAGGAF